MSRRYLVYIIVGLLLILFPQLENSYFLGLAIQVLIFSLFATSFNLLLGYTGMLSFGHGMFFGLGAYCIALFSENTSVHYLIALLATIGITIVFSFVVGFFCVRLGGAYFAMLTLAFNQLIFSVAFKWREMTGGDDGMPARVSKGMSFFPGLGLEISNPVYYYYFTLLVVIGSVLVIRKIVNSRFGLTIQAIRENQERTAFVGLNPFLIRWIIFVIAGVFGSLSGALFASFKGFVSPDVLSMALSGEALFITLIGGMFSFLGPFLGAIIMIFLTNLVSSLTRYWLIIVGCVFVLFVLFIPQGIMGIVTRREAQGGSLAREIRKWTSLRLKN
jgi:branched-chain amino acid transport system permease protein